jgi:hypothetical protein
MQEILRFLFRECDSSFKISRDSLHFNFKPFGVLIHFFPILSAQRNENEVFPSGEFDIESFHERNIKEIVITANRKPVCFSLYFLLKKMVNYYRKRKWSLYNTVIEHSISLRYGNKRRQTEEYSFEIKIHKDLWEDIPLFQYLMKEFSQPIDPLTDIIHFCSPLFKTGSSASDSKRLRILVTNTKARRLGYLKLLADFMGKNKTVAGSMMSTKFENYVEPFNIKLKQHKNPKGVIVKSKTGISAKPYIELARELGILSYLNGVYTPGKIFKVYIQLRSEIYDDQCFTLRPLDKFFFLELLLRNDFFYLLNLLELMYVYGSPNYAELIDCFHSYTLRKLNEILAQSGNWDESVKPEANKIKVIQKRIKEWDKPNKYLEHVLMPRLNWLLDLDLIDMDEKLNVSLTSEGLNLFKYICRWTDIHKKRVVNLDSFLDYCTIHTLDSIYQGHKDGRSMGRDERETVNQKIVNNINESFEYFRTLAPNRVTASQAINYTKYKLYFAYKLFVFKMQRRYHDGYIQKK